MFQTLRREHRNILIYYYLSMTRSAAFISGNWLFFWLRLMTFGQLGLVDASAFAFGMFMEIPTGALSDMLGKRLTLMAAMLFTGAGFVIMGAGDSLEVLLMGFLVTQVGWAFYSGADEAMAYDTLKENQQAERFDRVISTASVTGIITLVLSTLAGGVLYNIDMRLPHYAWGVVLLSGFFAAAFLHEPHAERDHFTVRGYARQLVRGAVQLTQHDLRPYLPLIFGLLGIEFLFGYGLVQTSIATSFGYMADGQAVISAVIFLISALTATLIPAMRRRFREMPVMVALAILMAAGFIGAAFPLGLYGFFALLMIRIAGSLAQPWSSIIINHRIPSEARTTTLSTVALVTKIPYVLTAVVAGKLAENNALAVFSLGTGIFLLSCAGASLLLRARMSSSTIQTVADYIPDAAG